MTRSTFAIPALLALATLVGLFAALTGDGWRDAVGWFGLALPVAAVCRAIVGRRTRRPTPSSDRKMPS